MIRNFLVEVLEILRKRRKKASRAASQNSLVAQQQSKQERTLFGLTSPLDRQPSINIPATLTRSITLELSKAKPQHLVLSASTSRPQAHAPTRHIPVVAALVRNSSTHASRSRL